MLAVTSTRRGLGTTAVLGLLLAVAIASTPLPAAAQELPDNSVEVGPEDDLFTAITRMEAGQTLLLRDGVYDDPQLARVPFNTRSDDPARPDGRIRMAAYPGERPVIRAQFAIRDASWWDFDGLTFEWPAQPLDVEEPLVRIMGGQDWTFTNNEVSGAVSYAGLYVGVSGESGPPRDFLIADNCVHTTRATGLTGATDHNLYVQNGLDGGPGVIERNVFYGAPAGTNIKLGSGSGSSSPSAANLEVRYNTLFDATQNMLVEPSVRSVTIQRNVMARVTDTRPELANLRSNGNTTGTVRALENWSWLAPRFIANTLEGQTTSSPQGIVDLGGNVHGQDARWDGTNRCDAFVPRNPAAAGYGHAATDETPPPPPPGPPTDDDPVRVSGPSRIDTAVRISQVARPDDDSADTAVLARADAFPDALSGAPLAASVDGPLLLTSRTGLDAPTRDELTRLGVSRVILLGGESALSGQVEADLRAAGVSQVERIAGSDRFDTSRRIAQQLGGPTAFLVEGANADPARGWPDAVSTSALAALTESPILLTTRWTLPGPTADALAELPIERLTVVGGSGAVSSQVEGEAVAAMGSGGSERLFGASRFATSALVAERSLTSGGSNQQLWVATGGNWPDALAAGPAAAATGGVFVLVPGGDLNTAPEVRDFVAANGAGAQVRIAGGIAAVSEQVEGQLLDLVRR